MGVREGGIRHTITKENTPNRQTRYTDPKCTSLRVRQFEFSAPTFSCSGLGELLISSRKLNKLCELAKRSLDVDRARGCKDHPHGPTTVGRWIPKYTRWVPRLRPCPSCAHHVLVAERSCPHCGAQRIGSSRRRVSSAAAAALLGLSLGACDKKGGETEPPMYGDDSGVDGSSAGAEPEYGVPDTGDEQDVGPSESEQDIEFEGSEPADPDQPHVDPDNPPEPIYGIAEPPE